MEHDQNSLKEAALLLITREREVLALRMKEERTAAWLAVTQSLPQHFDRAASVQEVYSRVSRSLIGGLKYQRVMLVSVMPGALRPLDRAGKPDLAIGAEVQTFLETVPSGVCNEPRGAGQQGLAERLRLHRFIWSLIDTPAGPPLLLAAGFDKERSEFHLPLEESDGAHFRNIGQQVGILLRNMLLVLEVQESNRKLEGLNVTLEQKVEERTSELTQRGRDMRLVLDNVAQGFLTVDTKGYLAQERSAIVDRWFGPYEGEITFADYARSIDREFGERFELAFEAYTDGFLPTDLCLDQLPTDFRSKTRDFRCSYSPLEEAEQQHGLLIVISDVTEQLVGAEKDAEQRDVMALVHGLMRDRSGYLVLLEEAGRIIEEVKHPGTDLTGVKRLLHTLKGNAGVLNLQVLAELCHRAEDELEETQAVAFDGSLGKVRSHWQTLIQTLHALLGERQSGMLEIEAAEIERLYDQARGGAPIGALMEALVYLRLEPVERALGRLAKYARELCQRLGKGNVMVDIDAHRVRLDPKRWSPLWTDVVHLVRNAVDHGFETTGERCQAGKPARPSLRLDTTVANGRFNLQISDDGRGIDWAEVRRIAAQRGLPCESQRDLTAALFAPAFSTRDNVTTTSGRGMGLSAVAERVREMGGTITLDSQPGRGACWLLSFPTSSPAGPDSALGPTPGPLSRAANQ